MTDQSADPDARLAPAERVDLLGVRVHDLSFAESIERIVEMSRRDVPGYVVTPNVDHVMMLEKDEHAAFRAAYADATLVLADGMPLVLASKLIGTPVREKISGSDLLPRLSAAAAEHGRTIYLLGGQPGAPERAAEILTARHPALEVVGVACPPVGFHLDADRNAAVIDGIRSARPHILFVGLGSPKQEVWIHEHHRALGVPAVIGCGAAIDFVSGHQRRAPRWMQRCCLEWFYRLVSEPRRMWRRYILQDSPFVLRVLKRVAMRPFTKKKPR